MTNSVPSRPAKILAVAGIAILFGIATLISGGSVLLVDGQARIDAGNYVPFVLWFNFLAGFFYIIAGGGLILWHRWAVHLSMIITLATVLMFAAFGAHISLDGAYEMRTVGAMVLRSVVWIAIALYTRAAMQKLS